MSKHQYYKCPPRCETPYCNYCQGGLASCTVCKGAEGYLPTDCPGHSMTAEEQDAVYSGHKDFRDGKGWICKATRSCSS